MLSINEKSKNKYKISSISFHYSLFNDYGILSIGYLTGEINLIKLKLNFSNNQFITCESMLIFKQTSFFLINEIERIQLIDIDKDRFLLIDKKEQSIQFTLITNINNELYTAHNNFTYEIDSIDDITNTQSSTTNYIIKNHNKICDFRINSDLEILIWFQNSNFKYLKLEIINQNSINLIENQLINNSVELKFDTSLINKCKKNDYFKINRNLFLSSNNALIFQLNDFNKLELIERKITQIELNIYGIRPYDKLITNIISTCSDLKKNDLFWLFKRQLYLNRDFYNQNMFQYLNTCFKNAMNSFDPIIFVKEARFISLNIGNYFEAVSCFDYFTNNQVTEEEESDGSDGSDEDESEQIEEESNDSNSKNKLNTDSIIKTAPYYLRLSRDFTLLIFKSYSLNTIKQMKSDKLNDKEKVIYALLCDFSIKKVFFDNKDLENRIKTFLKKNANQFNNLKCDLCLSKFNIAESNDLNKVVCEQGHVMNRCEKSLLPLNNFKFKKCYNCGSVWNLLNKLDYPLMSEYFYDQNLCLYCP